MGTHVFMGASNQTVEIDFAMGRYTGSDAIQDYHDYQNYLYAVCDEGQALSNNGSLLFAR